MSDAQPSRRVEDAWAALRAGSAHDQCAKKVLQRYYGDADRPQPDSQRQRPQKQPAAAVPAKSSAAASTNSIAASDGPESAITTGLDRSVQLLSNTGPSIRKSTLQRLQAACSSAPPEQASNALTEGLGKALLLRFEDSSEACRELAVVCFQQLLVKGEEATLHLLPYAMPVLEERLQLQEGRPREGSEEVRLQLVSLLAVLVRQAGTAVGAYLAEVVAMAAAALADGYHEVNLLGCSVVQTLIGILGQRLHDVSKQLVADVLPLTTHTRFRVRVVALQTLTPLIHLGAHEMILEMVAWRDPNMVPIAAFYGDDLKVNFCGKLASDPHTQVRAAFVDMIGNWMLTLTERMDHEGRLLPYVLSALCDEAPSVRDPAVKLLEQLGQLFEKDHQKDLIDELEYLHEQGTERPCAAAVCWGHRPGAFSAPAASSASDGTTNRQHHRRQQQGGLGQGNDTAVAAPAAAFHLPGPFSSRPRLGSRLLVEQNFSRVVGALTADVASWQAGPRESAVKLLLVQLVLMEGTVSQHLHILLPSMVKAMSNPDIAPTVEQCAEVMGCFADFGLLLELVEPLVMEAAAAPGVQADALTLLAACIRGGLYGQTLPQHTPAVLQLLSQGAIAASLDVRLNQASLAVLNALVGGLAQPVGLQQAAAVAQLLLGLVPWELASTAAMTAGSGPLVAPPPVKAAAAVSRSECCEQQQKQVQGAQTGGTGVQAVLAMCQQLQLGASNSGSSSSSSSSPEGLAQGRLRQCEGVLVRLAARCQLPGVAQLLQVVAPQALEQMEVGTWVASMPSPREVGRLCYLALPDPSVAPLLLQGGALWATGPPIAAGPCPVPTQAGFTRPMEQGSQQADTPTDSSSSESSSERACAVVDQVLHWLAHGSTDSSQEEAIGSVGGSLGTQCIGAMPDSSCALLLTAFDLILQHTPHRQQQVMEALQQQLEAGLVCLLQDSTTQLAGLRCCHWLLAGGGSSTGADWAAAWCWRHCSCLVRILQGHSPLLQAWVCQVLLGLAAAQRQPRTSIAGAGPGPLPAAAVRGLAGALDAANAQVRCAAAAVLVEVLASGSSSSQLGASAEPGDCWLEAREEAVRALQAAGDVVAAAGLQAQLEAVGGQ